MKAAYSDEYWQFQDSIQEITHKVSFIKMLIDQWSRLDSVLNNLSRNMRQEMVSLSIENRLNKQETNTRVRTEFPTNRRTLA